MIFYLLSSNVENLAKDLLNNTFWQKPESQNDCFLLIIKDSKYICSLNHEEFLKHFNVNGYKFLENIFLHKINKIIELLEKNCSLLKNSTTLSWSWHKGYWDQSGCLIEEKSSKTKNNEEDFF